MHAYIHTNINTRIMYIHTYIGNLPVTSKTSSCVSLMHTYKQTNVHTYKRKYIHSHIKYIHTYIHTCIHPYIHTWRTYLSHPRHHPVSLCAGVCPSPAELRSLLDFYLTNPVQTFGGSLPHVDVWVAVVLRLSLFFRLCMLPWATLCMYIFTQ